jgi:hypothetical protein
LPCQDGLTESAGSGKPPDVRHANGFGPRIKIKITPGRRCMVAFLKPTKGNFIMLYTIVVILVILWVLGLIGHIGGGLIHLLLVIAIIVLLFNFLSGRRGP